jgi:hypothetical protein
VNDAVEPKAGVLDGEAVEEMLVADDDADDPHSTPPRDPSKDRAIIAWMLIGIMAGGLLFHYMAVIAFEWNGKHEAVKSLEPILNAWLPVVSGLAGAAVTYYFTRERQ